MAAPTVRSFSAAFDPLRLIERFPGRYPGLLESNVLGAPSAGGRYDILPISNGECLRLDNGGLSGPYSGSAGFLNALDTWWRSLSREEATPAAAALTPFSGGWLLYLGYELSQEIEPLLRLPRSSEPTALAIRTPAAWIRDRASGCAWAVAEQGAEALLGELEDHVRGLAASRLPRSAAMKFEVIEEDPTKFALAVSRALDYIAAGDVYQANLSRCWHAHCEQPVDVVALYEQLRTTNPSPFAALLCAAGFAVMSSSPERLLAIRGGIVSTRPIAGTRPRGGSPERDAALIAALLSNEKERAEHVMLIDLERNDLGRVCAAGSVHVDEYMRVETYAHVHHIVSNVSGRLRKDVSPVDVIRAMFPGGTITGCPKVRCMQIIAELEGSGRGAYTGSIGYLNRDGSCDFNILIRTLTATLPGDQRIGGIVTFRAGAGIVADSVAPQELAETRAKAQGLLRAVEAGA